MVKVAQHASSGKQVTHVAIRTDLLTTARELGLSISSAAEGGLERAIAEAREARWREENREAIDSANAYVERHGLPLERYRRF